MRSGKKAFFQFHHHLIPIHRPFGLKHEPAVAIHHAVTIRQLDVPIPQPVVLIPQVVVLHHFKLRLDTDIGKSANIEVVSEREGIKQHNNSCLIITQKICHGCRIEDERLLRNSYTTKSVVNQQEEKRDSGLKRGKKGKERKADSKSEGKEKRKKQWLHFCYKREKNTVCVHKKSRRKEKKINLETPVRDDPTFRDGDEAKEQQNRRPTRRCWETRERWGQGYDVVMIIRRW
ncbi:hypothetical protein Tco_0276721 [Tanacetum coccineum]